MAQTLEVVLDTGEESQKPAAETDDAKEGDSRLANVPLGLILRNSLDRPWLSLYRDRPLAEDAARIAEHNTLALAAGEEVWLKICLLVGWLDLGRLGQVCSMLQRVAANELCWEPRCWKAWKLRGFQRCEQVLYAYGFSYKRMVRRCAMIHLRQSGSLRTLP